jgi:hypothetical protein
MKPPFFIVGIGRSGTTLLRLMLHNHPQIAIPYESHFITEYYRNIEKYGDLQNHDNLHRLVSDILNEDLISKWDHTFDIDRVLNNITESNLSNVLNAIYQDYATSKNKARWGDKSDYLDNLHIIHRLFPDARFIHIVRDGRDVANSVIKLDWGPRDIIQAAEWWDKFVLLGRRMGQMLPQDQYTEIKYEDLVLNTEKELKRLCEFLDEEYSELMLNYHQSSSKAIPAGRSYHYNSTEPPKQSRVFAWKNEMSKLDAEIFNNYAHLTLDEFNYEQSNYEISKWKIFLAKIFILGKRIFK